jgi:signal transduction histidine kinase
MPLFGLEPAALLENIFEGVGVALAIVNAEGRVVFANQAALTMFAKSGDWEPLHVEDWFRGYRVQDSQGRDISADGSMLMRVLAGEQVEPQDNRVTLPNGAVKWLHTSAHRFSTMGQSGVLVVVTDDTVQAELRDATAHVQHLESLATAARCLAHDFNNLLNTISSDVYLALLSAGIPKPTRVHLEQISVASQKAAELVKRLMQFGRIQELQIQSVQINEVICDVLQLLSSRRPADVAVQRDLCPHLPMVEADRAQLEQVLVNLMVNAADAMPKGGKLTISTEVVEPGVQPRITGQAAEQAVRISVCDTGCGIPEDLQFRIFEPFFTTKSAEKASGLGLSSVYGIVRQHGGTITVQSAPGKGAEFCISLPVKQPSSSKETSTGA